VLYITHDLATAYYISDAIMVLYQGSVVEAGDIRLVIEDPKHPYTELLVDSVPWPDITIQWGQQIVMTPTPEDQARLAEALPNCCKFAPRCPYVMPECWKERPALYSADSTRVAACFRYREKPELPQEELGELLSTVEGPAA
jgi:peptide/nickel transport system ATP-binding protein